MKAIPQGTEHSMGLRRRNLLIATASTTALSSPLCGYGASPPKVDLGFERAFPRHFYEKSYFGYAITGATIVAAGAFSYMTAGAGAPIAATGVSTIASWVAGGGAGSYMAGLATIGGWFGGNAMLGAAILNGISLGTVGGVTSFGALNAGQKALVLTSIAATTLDGVAPFLNPQTSQLGWDVRLSVPLGLADGDVKELGKHLSKAYQQFADLMQDLENEKAKIVQAGSKTSPQSPKLNLTSAKFSEIERELAAQNARVQTINKQVLVAVDTALNSDLSPSNDLVLAVLAYNLGEIEKFRTLLKRVVRARPTLERSSYLSYLQGVSELVAGKESQAMSFLQASWRAAPFAIEAPILMINILGRKEFVANEGKIFEIAEKAKSKFDTDAYSSLLTTVSMYYRVGSQALQAKRCDRALDAFTQADTALSSIQKYVAGKDIRNLIDVGKANALYCSGKKAKALELAGVALNRAKENEKEMLCLQFAGGCK